MIGFLQVISNAYGYGRWSEAVIFTTLILVLIFRPTGLLGQQTGGSSMTAQTAKPSAARARAGMAADSAPLWTSINRYGSSSPLCSSR